MGLPGTNTVNQTALEYTSSKSIFTMDVAGAVEMNITFMSPITPNDFKRQSLVFSYLNVEVSSLDGKDHDVQVYADISAGESMLFIPGLSYKFLQLTDNNRMGIWRPVCNC